MERFCLNRITSTSKEYNSSSPVLKAVQSECNELWSKRLKMLDIFKKTKINSAAAIQN
jgi:hypothetical protein